MQDLTTLKGRIFLSFFTLFVLLFSLLSCLWYYLPLNLQQGKNLLVALGLMNALALVLTFFAAKILTQRIFLPLQALIESAQRISCGTFTQRLAETEIGELAGLTNSFNRMAEEVSNKSRLLEEKIKEMSHIYDFHRLGNKISNPQELLKTLLNKTLEILQVESGFLFLLEKEKWKSGELFTEELESSEVEQIQEFILEKIQSKSLNRGMVFLIPYGGGKRPGFICIPLYLKKELVGILGADDIITRRSFNEGPQTVLFLTIANQLISFIERIHLYQALEKKLFQRKKELDALLKVSRIANENKDIAEILKIIVRTTVKVMGADKGLIILWDEEKDKLVFQAHYGLNRSFFENTENFSLEQRVLDAVKKGQPLLIPDVSQIDVPEWSNKLIEKDISSIFMMPLWVKDKLLGSVVIFSNNPRSYSEEEEELYQSLANQAAITIENSSLYDNLQQAYGDLKRSYLKTMTALINAIEAKDAYTKGHAERVAAYAWDIGEELGLDKEFLENIKVAGNLHDIGKIGIPEKVLTKPGKLTDEEFNIMKSHSFRGQEILEPVAFDQEIINGVYYHHERLDGRGYPKGLKAGEIPLIARILAVADAFDAMTSNRPYRNSLPYDFALSELKNCNNSQFDSQVVEAFLRVWEKKGEAYIRKNQGEKMASA